MMCRSEAESQLTTGLNVIHAILAINLAVFYPCPEKISEAKLKTMNYFLKQKEHHNVEFVVANSW